MNINGVSLNSTPEAIQTNGQQIAQLQQRIQTIQSSANSHSSSQVQTTKQKSEALNSKQKEDKLDISQEGLEKLKQMQTSGKIV